MELGSGLLSTAFQLYIETFASRIRERAFLRAVLLLIEERMVSVHGILS